MLGLVEGELLERINDLLRVSDEPTLSQSQVGRHFPETFNVEIVTCHWLNPEDLFRGHEESRVECRRDLVKV